VERFLCIKFKLSLLISLADVVTEDGAMLLPSNSLEFSELKLSESVFSRINSSAND